MTTTPIVLHLVRPYAGVEEYLAAEAWSVDARNMLLIGEPALPADTPIVFDVTLGDGSRPIKAEARVSRFVEPKDGKPGGLRVRFKRYGAPTKAFIDRALALVATGAAPAPSAASATGAEPLVASAPDAAPVEARVAPEVASPLEARPEFEPPRPEVEDATTLFRVVSSLQTSRTDLNSLLDTLRGRAAEAPETPGNREYLLEKLRQRGQGEDQTMRYRRSE